MTQVLLIDGERVSPAEAEGIRRRFGAGGAVCRVYGTPEGLRPWEGSTQADLRHVARGGSATAFAIAVDALTLAHGKRVRAFVLAGFAGDPGWLVTHLRAQGCAVELIAGDEARTRPHRARLRAGDSDGRVIRLVPAETGAAGGSEGPVRLTRKA